MADSVDHGAGVTAERVRDCLDAVLQQTQGASPATTHVTVPISVMDDVARVLESCAARPTPAGDGLEPLGCSIPGACACPGGETRLAERLGTAQREKAAAETALSEARAVLRKIEWVGVNIHGCACPICKRLMPGQDFDPPPHPHATEINHKSDCALAVALTDHPSGATRDGESGDGARAWGGRG